MTDRIRVVVAAPGPDAGDGELDGRGMVTRLTRALRDAGVEVIYVGLHPSPEQIVATALQEDVDAIGLAVRADDQRTVVPTVLRLLAELDAGDVAVFGGAVPEADVDALEGLGLAKAFTPEATATEIARWLRNTVMPSEPAQP